MMRTVAPRPAPPCSRSRRRSRLAGSGLLGLLWALAGLAQAEPAKRPCQPALPSCVKCHAPAQAAAKLKRLDRPCDQYCRSCHKDRSGHHPVGKSVKAKTLPPLVLRPAGVLVCVTCHDPSARRHDDKSWKSQSLFARLFRRQKTYKTFYLRVNNASGALCKICH